MGNVHLVQEILTAMCPINIVTADVLLQIPVVNVLPASPVRRQIPVLVYPVVLTLTAPAVLVTATPATRVTLTPDVQRLKPVPTQPRLLLVQASVKTLGLLLVPKTERPITTDVVRLSVLPDRPVPTEHARTPVSVAEAALVRDKPQVVRLLRFRLLLVKIVPAQHTTLVEPRPVRSKARKTATVPVSTLPNAAEVVRADKNAKMVAALQVVLCRSAKIK